MVVVPDYSGNRLMTSLGNIAVTPLAGLAFPDFASGDVLYLTGEAETLFDDEAEAIMPRMRRVTCVKVTGAVFIKGALPFRQDGVDPSPYNLPVRYLATESFYSDVQTLASTSV